MGPAFLPRRKQTEAKHPKKESPSLLSTVKCLVLPHLTPVPGRCWWLAAQQGTQCGVRSPQGQALAPPHSEGQARATHGQLRASVSLSVKWGCAHTT